MDILRTNPDVNVNWRHGPHGHGALHRACEEGGLDLIVSSLLAHPDIDVNLKTDAGSSPFFVACSNGHTSCVRLLLRDSRVNLGDPDDNGDPPLIWAAYYGYLEICRWWIASGREMDLGEPGDQGTDVIWVAKRPPGIGVNHQEKKAKLAILLERFKENTDETKHAVRVELGWYDNVAAEVFALVVFVSDGLLQTKDTTTSPTARFFNIARRLPLELQMVLCFRLVGSCKEIVLGNDSEVAFKSLARRLMCSSMFTS